VFVGVVLWCAVDFLCAGMHYMFVCVAKATRVRACDSILRSCMSVGLRFLGCEDLGGRVCDLGSDHLEMLRG